MQEAVRRNCRPKAETEKKVAIRWSKRIGSIHGHNSANYSNPPTNRSTANLAVQFWLGLLPERRPRLDSFNRADPGVAGTNLNVRKVKEIERERQAFSRFVLLR